jgi:hypothetical protein
MIKNVPGLKFSWLLLLILMLGINYSADSQANVGEFQGTKMELQLVDKEGKALLAHTDLCYMFLNITNGDFMFKTDASTFETGDLNIDTLLNSNGPQPIIFKGNMNENLFRFIHDENDGKMHDMEGVLTINGVDVLCVAQFSPISFGDKNDKKNYRLDFRLYVDANKITIKGLENKLTKQVLFEVARGMLNISN